MPFSPDCPPPSLTLTFRISTAATWDAYAALYDKQRWWQKRQVESKQHNKKTMHTTTANENEKQREKEQQ